MNRLQTALRAFGSALSGVGKGVLSLTPPYIQHLLWLISNTFRDLCTRAYSANAAVYACIRLLSTAVPEPPLVPYTRQPDGEPGDALLWDHPLRKLIRRPNPLMTEFEFWELATIHCDIVGRSTWYKERNNLGQTIALWPLRPDRVGPIYSGPEDVDKVLWGWSYRIMGEEPLQIPRRDILCFNFPDPMGESGGMVEGLGPLQVLATEVGADNTATNFVGSLLANYASPGIILQTKTPIADEATARLIKAAFMSQYGGVNTGAPAIIDNDTAITPVGFSLQQLEFPALRRVSESRISAAFGVPAVLVGLLVGLEAGIRATIEEQRAYFAETTLSAYWRRFGDQFTEDVASEFGSDIVCIFDTTKVRAMATQAAMQLATIRDAADRSVLTVNEYRIALGFEPRTDGDVYIMGIAPGRGVETLTAAGDTMSHEKVNEGAVPSKMGTSDNPDRQRERANTVAAGEKP